MNEILQFTGCPSRKKLSKLQIFQKFQCTRNFYKIICALLNKEQVGKLSSIEDVLPFNFIRNFESGIMQFSEMLNL